MIRLFVVSYAPLSLIFAVRLAPNWYWTAGFSVLAGWGVLDAWLLGRWPRSGGSYTAKIDDVQDQSTAVSGYLATYLLPFLGNLPAKPGDVIAYVIYFLVAFAIFARSDLALINPTLYLLRWRVHRVETEGKAFLLLTREPVNEGDRVTVHRFMGDVLIKSRDMAS
jgi:membrane protein implicated in regulation of membrane protease activity